MRKLLTNIPRSYDRKNRFRKIKTYKQIQNVTISKCKLY